MLERIASELGKDAILLPADRGGFITTIKKRPDERFYEWLDALGKDAELRAPDDLVKKYASHRQSKLASEMLFSLFKSQLMKE